MAWLAACPGPLCDIRWSVSSLSMDRFSTKISDAKVGPWGQWLLVAMRLHCCSPASTNFSLRSRGIDRMECVHSSQIYTQTGLLNPALFHCRGFYETFGMHRQKPLAGVHRGSRGTCSDLQALLPKPAGVNPRPRFTVPPKIILIIVRQTPPADEQFNLFVSISLF